MEMHCTRPHSRWNRLTARVDGRTIGWLEWAPAGDEFAPGEITVLTVIPVYRRKGVATAL